MDGTIIAKNVNVLMPLNQQPKLQWSVPFPNGPVTISVMTKTTTPSADLMEAIVVIMTARVGITTAASVSALKCQQPLKNPGIPPKTQWRPLKSPWGTVLPHTGLEMPSVMTKTTPKSVDLMVEIVVTTKDKDGTTTVLIVNVFNKFYVKNVFIHYLISRNKSCSIT